MPARDPAVAPPFDQGVFLLHYNKGREAFQAQQAQWEQFSRSIDAVLEAARPAEPVLQEVGAHGRPD